MEYTFLNGFLLKHQALPVIFSGGLFAMKNAKLIMCRSYGTKPLCIFRGKGFTSLARRFPAYGSPFVWQKGVRARN